MWLENLQFGVIKDILNDYTSSIWLYVLNRLCYFLVVKAEQTDVTNQRNIPHAWYGKYDRRLGWYVMQQMGAFLCKALEKR